MSDTIERSGRCLCNSIQFLAKTMRKEIGACHCAMCRKWGGGPLMVADCGQDVVFEKKDTLSIHDSSDWADRGFCNQCGTHLFYRFKQTQQYMMPVGLFDDDSDLSFTEQVFVDDRPDYYAFANNTHEMTGEECFAAYNAEQK